MRYCTGDRVILSSITNGKMTFVKYADLASDEEIISAAPSGFSMDCIVCDNNGITHRALSRYMKLYSPLRRTGAIVRVHTREWFSEHGIQPLAGQITDSASGLTDIMNREMMELCGQYVTISRISASGFIKILEDDERYAWTSSMFEIDNCYLTEQLKLYILILISEIGITGNEEIDSFDIPVISDFPVDIAMCSSVVYSEESGFFICSRRNGTHEILSSDVSLLSLAHSLEKIKQNNHC